MSTAASSTRMRITGQCHCGAVTFEAQADPGRVLVCHCSDCQVFSGAPFRAVLPVEAAQLVLRGTPKTYVKVADSGKRRAQAFCGECGTQLYGAEPDAPHTFNLRLGCINERAALPPVRQIWCGSAMPWLPQLAQAPSYAAGPDGPLVRAPQAAGSAAG